MTYKELVVNAVKRLKEADIPDAAFDVKCMALRAADRDSAGYYLMMKEEVSPQAAEIFSDFMERRMARQPLQLILGDTEFMGLPFIVDGNELIPRQETEILTELAIKYLNQLEEGGKVLDLFTGSGCIATSIAHYVNGAEVYGGDVSEDALKNAKTNAAYNFVKVDFRLGDMFEAFEGETFDVITANPPYIPSGQIDSLMPEVKNYDPLLALDGGEDGLVFYRRLADESREYLKDGGKLFMEIGFDQGEAVTHLLADAGYKDIGIIKDYSGLDRVVIATKD